MNVKRYFGRNTREAMLKLREAMGEDAVVLKTRAVEGGIEVLAMSEASAGIDFDALAGAAPARRAPANERASERVPQAAPAAAARAPANRPTTASSPKTVERAAKPAAIPADMSTLSFQQFVRDRLARQGSGETSMASAPAARVTAQVTNDVSLQMPVPPLLQDPLEPGEPFSPVPTGTAQAFADQTDLPAIPLPKACAPGATVPAEEPASQAGTIPTLTQVLRPVSSQNEVELLNELRSMRGLIANQLSSMTWIDGVRRNPVHSELLRRLMNCGFSPALSRQLIGRAPSDFGEEALSDWARDGLTRLLRCDAPGDSILERGGIIALIGPTGVGKTTTAAKIAAQFAIRHGVQSVGLLTVDAYRIGGQDQLRAFGRLLGVPVHVANDAGTLAEFLHLFMNKKLVIIDTVGVGQRDERVHELMASLGSSTIRKLLVLNAAAQAETLEDVIKAYRGSQAAGVVISKVDEAVKLAGALDCVIRHRLRVVGLATGQRVPEDWQLPDAGVLVDQALAASGCADFELQENDLAMVFADGAALPEAVLNKGTERSHV